MDDARSRGTVPDFDALMGWPSRGIQVTKPPKRRRGRPPGISPQRQAALACLVQEGLSLGQIARRLGVSRQCIHTQLRKCPELEAKRREARTYKLTMRKAYREEQAAWEALLKRRHGKELVRFLLEAQRRGWSVILHPRRRPRVNGFPLAFHHPLRVRRASTGQGSKTRYYHVRITRTDWLHVVALPSGRYLIWPPGTIARVGSVYIPVTQARTVGRWPQWPAEMSLSRDAA